ncbi:DUF397 domain-containing protein [Kitasatospora sp. NBC_01287]|uniref:DUF397 domain-containing protein n=1 Tax=Kitasatospora sp. NBC_01287 TaxID=2903573 RepID=UPI002250F1FD|nr:DUF397 domain-containing protein [Kitasatospora sp. NBC_01287]MCX4749189.1 DUF397 domain-containing protein [Kitasatospora sp. NBC_01287]
MIFHPVASALPVQWTKATASNPNDNCVECGVLNNAVVVRDSKNPDGPAHVYRAPAFAAFVKSVAVGSLVRADI